MKESSNLLNVKKGNATTTFQKLIRIYDLKKRNEKLAIFFENVTTQPKFSMPLSFVRNTIRVHSCLLIEIT